MSAEICVLMNRLKFTMHPLKYDKKVLSVKKMYNFPLQNDKKASYISNPYDYKCHMNDSLCLKIHKSTISTVHMTSTLHSMPLNVIQQDYCDE